MKRSWLVNVALALLVIGLGLWMTLAPDQEAGESFALSRTRPAEVGRIEIRRKGLAPIVLERQNGQWRQTAPFAARAESSQVDRLLDLLAAKATSRLPTAELARFELDDPFATVSFGGETFAFGTVNTLTNEQYVRAGEHIYLVSPAFGYGLPTRADALASHRLLGDDEIPAGLELGPVVLAAREGRLELRGTASTEAPSQDDLNRWLDRWRYASALSVNPQTADARGDNITVALKSGKRLRFVVERAGADVHFHRADEQLRYTLSGEQSEALLAVERAARQP